MELDLSRTLYVTPPTGVALVSTIDKNQRNNIAPFAWWTIVSKEPPLIAISTKPSTNTYRIIKESAEFTIGIPDQQMADTVYHSANLEKESDEFTKLQLTPQLAVKISAPRIKECQVNIECRYKNQLECGDHIIVIGEVVAVSVRDDIIHDDDAAMRKNLDPLYHLTKNKFVAKNGTFVEAKKQDAN